jgi:phospholipid/cholesterol/gamma-HCH transport system substrate-binding protein
MEISKAGLPLYRDATATIRWRSVLGGTVIVELDRGTPAAGEMPSPRHIPLKRTHTQVELDQVASVLRGGARAGFKTLLAETPRALAEPTQPARALGTLADVSPSVRAAASAVRGEQEGDLRELVLQSSRAAKALERPRAVRDFVQGAAVTLQTTANREADVRRTIDLAGRTQPRIQATLAALDSTLGRADPLIADLREPAGQVAPALARLRPVLSQTSALLRSARPLLHALRPASSGLAGAARIGDPLLRELTPSLERSDTQILKSANEKKDRFSGLTMRETVGPTMAVFDGLTAHFDHLAHVVRFAASVGERELNASPCGTYLLNPSTSQLVACKGLTEALSDVFTWHPVEVAPRKAGR